MSRKRVLYVESSTAGMIGGSHHSLFHLISGLDKTEFEPVVVFYEKNEMIDKFEELGVFVNILQPPSTFRLVPEFHSSLRFLSPVRNLVNSIANFFVSTLFPVFRRVAWLRRERIDIVHLNNNPFSGDWVLACRFRGTPCVAHQRGMRQRLDWFHRLLAAKVDVVFCISRAVYDSLAACGCDTRNFKILHNGIDPDQFVPWEPAAAVKARLGTKEEGVPVVGMIGNIKRWKGQVLLVRALAILDKSFPGIIGIFVGSYEAKDTRYFEQITSEIDSYGLGKQVFFTGYTKAVPDYVNIMDLVVHASIDPEPFGRVVIEAMAMGKPVVGSRDGGVVEIIDEPRCGLTFTPGDSEDLAGKIQQILGDPSLAAAMGKAGRERVDKYFQSSVNAEKTCAVYRELLQLPDES